MGLDNGHGERGWHLMTEKYDVLLNEPGHKPDTGRKPVRGWEAKRAEKERTQEPFVTTLCSRSREGYTVTAKKVAQGGRIFVTVSGPSLGHRTIVLEDRLETDWQSLDELSMAFADVLLASYTEG